MKEEEYIHLPVKDYLLLSRYANFLSGVVMRLPKDVRDKAFAEQLIHGKPDEVVGPYEPDKVAEIFEREYQTYGRWIPTEHLS